MDWAVLVISVIGAAAAIAAAVFAYPAWQEFRKRPDLRLEMWNPPTSWQVRVQISNEETAAVAHSWKLIMEGAWQPSNLSGMRGIIGRGEHSVIWQASGADDTIGPGLSIQAQFDLPGQRGDTFRDFPYRLTADRMKPRTVRIVISDEGDPRKITLE